MLVGVAVGGVDGLHAHVETQDEVVEVEAQAQTVGHGQLLVELVEAELSAGLFGIVAQRPDVARIDEGSSIELPEEEGAIFEVEVELHIARLVDEVDAAVGTTERARSQSAHAPSAHRVGTAREVALLEGQHSAVAVGPGNAEVGMRHELVVGVELPQVRVVEVELHVLGIGNTEERVLPILVLVEPGGM